MSLKKKIYYFLATLALLMGLFSRKSFATLYRDLSALERQTVDQGLARHGLVPETDPEGKIIGQIWVYTDMPFGAGSGFLTPFNQFHLITKDEVVERELFQKSGDIYDAALCRDAEMVLRNENLVRSFAVIVPVNKQANLGGQTIDLLVATRDLWSLKPSFNFSYAGSVLTSLSAGLGEYNLLGQNKAVVATYDFNQVNHGLLAAFYEPRLLGSKLEFNVSSKFLFTKKSFGFDGFIGNLSLERPLRSEADLWGYGIEVEYGNKEIVDFAGDHVRTYDIPSTVQVEKIEQRYRWRYGTGQISGRRSFGRIHKKEIFSSYNLYVKKPSISRNLDIKASEIEFFKHGVLPKEEVESYVTLGFTYFQNRYLAMYDCDNFKLQELKRVGPVFSVANDFSAQSILLSDHNFLRPQTSASFLAPMNRDAYAYASVSTSNRYDGTFTDNTYKFGYKLVSPKILSAARLVTAGVLSFALDNRDNQNFVLGAGNGLRGVESRFYSGSRVIRGNFEIRSAPIDLWITHLGLALFYDAGVAFDRWQNANATHAVGIGLRILAPQLSGQLFRIDFGFPIYGRGAGLHAVVPSLGTGQAF